MTKHIHVHVHRSRDADLVPAWVAIVGLAGPGTLLGGVKQHKSAPFSTASKARAWAETVMETNRKNGSKDLTMALQEVKARPSSIADAEREPNQSDLNASARGLNMLGMSPADLEDLIREQEGKTMFASRVILLAAKQMLAAKRRMGAQ